MESTIQATTTATASSPSISIGPANPFVPLFDALQGSFGGSIFSDFFGTLNTIWSVYTLLAYVAALVFLYIFIYASIRISGLQAHLKAGIEAQRQAYTTMHGVPKSQSQFASLQAHIESDNPNDWKLAIIEADIILDEALRKAGYGGGSLGERLKGISPQHLQTIEEAWSAHKVRNQIAHAGTDFVLTHKIVRDTMSRYRAVFQELGLING